MKSARTTTRLDEFKSREQLKPNLPGQLWSHYIFIGNVATTTCSAQFVPLCHKCFPYLIMYNKHPFCSRSMAQKFEEFLHCQLDTKGSSNLNQPYFEIPCLGVLAAGPFEWQFISYSPSAPPFYSTTSPPPPAIAFYSLFGRKCWDASTLTDTVRAKCLTQEYKTITKAWPNLTCSLGHGVFNVLLEQKKFRKQSRSIWA